MSNAELRIELIKQVDADIVSINETHFKDNDVVQMDGYVWRGYNRGFIHRNAPKASGGVGLLIKQWIFEEFDYETLDMSFEGILSSKFTLKHSDYNFLVF